MSSFSALSSYLGLAYMLQSWFWLWDLYISPRTTSFPWKLKLCPWMPQLVLGRGLCAGIAAGWYSLPRWWKSSSPKLSYQAACLTSPLMSPLAQHTPKSLCQISCPQTTLPPMFLVSVDDITTFPVTQSRNAEIIPDSPWLFALLDPPVESTHPHSIHPTPFNLLGPSLIPHF